MLFRLSRRSLLPLVAGVLVMAACDDDDDPVAPPVTETADATLTATPLNPTTASGTATFSLTGDALTVTVDAAGADTSTTIRQHVHVNGACPTQAADTNADGFIDGVEAGAVVGLVLVPLDGDISTQSAGATGFPVSDATGAYEWADTVSFSTLISDLTAADPDPNDQLAKLTGTDIELDTRVVQLHGVADTLALPGTVAALPGLTPQQSLPIACGAIEIN